MFRDTRCDRDPNKPVLRFVSVEKGTRHDPTRDAPIEGDLC